MKFYAVRNGRVKGIFFNWSDCEAQVKGFNGAQYRAFKNIEEARDFVLGVQTVAPKANQNFVTPTKPVETVQNDTFNDHPFHVYVDGGFKDGQYSWAYAVYHNNQLIHSDYGVGQSKDAALLRNVAGELAASMRALQWALKNKKRITIIYDYVGIAAWVTGEWKCKNDLTKQYAMFMNKYRSVFNFYKVKGHSGDPGNELVDSLARKALGI